jgi:hypothetical protein
VNSFKNEGVYNKALLDSMPAIEETQYVRHVRFDRPLKIMKDGMKQEGLVVLNRD